MRSAAAARVEDHTQILKGLRSGNWLAIDIDKNLGTLNVYTSALVNNAAIRRIVEDGNEGFPCVDEQVHVVAKIFKYSYGEFRVPGGVRGKRRIVRI